MLTEQISKRYSGLAKTNSCLSCGGAINHALPQPGETAVDLGSGRGNDCIRLAERVGAAGHVYGIDISDGMIEKARAAIAEKAIKTIELIKSPIEQIPLPTGSVHLVISNCTINHANNKEAVWREIFRVLKPGGRFVVSDIYSLEPVPDMYRNDPDAVAACWAGAVIKEVYLATLRETGFATVEILEESEPYVKGSINVSSITLRGFKPAL